MRSVVKDQRNLRGKIYGYCDCGRELSKKDSNEIKCPVCGKELVWDRLEVGDTIKCSTKEEMVDVMTELAKEDIQTDFLYERDGEKGLWLKVVNVPYMDRLAYLIFQSFFQQQIMT